MNSEIKIKNIEGQETPRLQIEISTKNPVELTDLTASFAGLANEYKRYIEKESPELMGEEIKLYIKEIKTGSIITDLISKAPYILPFIEHTTTIIEFSKYIKLGYEYLLGKNAQKPNLTKVNYENFSNIVEPIAKDGSSQLNINTFVNNGIVMAYNINSVEANAAQNAAKREIGKLKEPTIGLQDKVLLYWYQARNDPKSNIGDKAIIESIQMNPVKVIFDNEEVKAKMLWGVENPFISAYIVDVMVQTINGKPAIYRILSVHDRIEKPESENII